MVLARHIFFEHVCLLANHQHGETPTKTLRQHVRGTLLYRTASADRLAYFLVFTILTVCGAVRLLVVFMREIGFQYGH